MAAEAVLVDGLDDPQPRGTVHLEQHAGLGGQLEDPGGRDQAAVARIAADQALVRERLVGAVGGHNRLELRQQALLVQQLDQPVALHTGEQRAERFGLEELRDIRRDARRDNQRTGIVQLVPT